MPLFFSAFGQDIEDFFKKHYISGNKGQFRMESHLGKSDEKLHLTNVYEGNIYSTNLHYNSKPHGFQSKVSLFSNGTMGLSVLWNYVVGVIQNSIEIRDNVELKKTGASKVEVTHRSSAHDVTFETNFQTLLSGSALSTAVGVSWLFPGVKRLVIGCGTEFDGLLKNLSPVKYGGVYNLLNQSAVSFVADQKGDYDLGVMANCADFLEVSKNITGALQVSKKAKQILFNFGVSALCPSTGSALRFKSDTQGKYGIGVSRTLNDGTQFNIGFEGDWQSEFKFPADRLSISLVTE
mmetsp:Transcript_11726/g.17775  ORF Transcript_11726/g.17775 Transcript_11726/m.17775 type:complete len:293 (-) Transcript_11726:109-987(-)|eukprot:CAMPEP_0201523796 /NCGR_PEP_ID=MMETSP0161_2-20130828/20926_1 /ASSEMBLY_ACC=CAM_ASM_000251 /TAXON_ID=180227 /ORGANISM="Neoparamoeba aestuarina, Strain SoJaBio B1-5/56/2" /LENGTH=292 /DNA_ID=CAMNT_0047923011 /DNA_START=28 /DNA_END=906 /DNA_ORIENTATION=+